MSNEYVIKLDNDNFETEVVNSEVPVIVDFYADWCGPCKMVGPIMDEIACELDGKIKVCKINVDGQRELARKHKVMSIPTVMFYKKGEQINRVTGVYSKEEFIDIINKVL